MRVRWGRVSAVAVAVVALSAVAAWGLTLTPTPGRYAGALETFDISFKVENGKISRLVSNFEATTCRGLAPAEPSPSFAFPTLAINNGHFTGSVTMHDGSGLRLHFKIRGRFITATRAKGTLREHISVPAGFGAPACTASSVFSASRINKRRPRSDRVP